MLDIICVFASEVSLSSDFISGFCGETEDDHQQTLSLIREVGYNVGFLFAYSMRKVSSYGFLTHMRVSFELPRGK